jgi:hypothetical protein
MSGKPRKLSKRKRLGKWLRRLEKRSRSVSTTISGTCSRTAKWIGGNLKIEEGTDADADALTIATTLIYTNPGLNLL